jgi:hypothetical protein
MVNGQPRVERFAKLPVEEHLHMLDNELDTQEKLRRDLIDKWERKLNWILTTFISLLVLLCGTLLAVVIKS